jgi:hypothetical protein
MSLSELKYSVLLLSQFSVNSNPLIDPIISAGQGNGEGGEESLPHAGLHTRRWRRHGGRARPAAAVGQPEAPALREGASPRRRGRGHHSRREGGHRPAPRHPSSCGRAAPPNWLPPPRPQVCAPLFSAIFYLLFFCVFAVRVACCSL